MLMKVAFFVVSFLLLFVSVFGQCGNYTSSSGSIYYISPLTSPLYDYQAVEAGTPYRYYWNFCRNLLWTSCVSPTPVTQVSDDTLSCLSVGYLANYQLKDHPSGPNSGFQLNYVNSLDNKCAGNTVNRQTNIIVSCDSTVEIAFVSITEPGICFYNINLRSKYACPISNEAPIKSPK